MNIIKFQHQSKLAFGLVLTIALHVFFWIALTVKLPLYQGSKQASSTLILLKTKIFPKRRQQESQITATLKLLHHSSTKPALSNDVIHVEPPTTIEEEISEQHEVTEKQALFQQDALAQQAHANAGKIYRELIQHQHSFSHQLKPTTFEEKLGKDIQKAAIKDCQKDYSDNNSTGSIISLAAFVVYDTVTNKCKWR
ncbi:hypothetical protein ACO0K7_04605 [Undibacterium sp. Ji67W]|uniref:hypothetical protein n=1 Tax=Undibacterium sp. Ji67W TaxID=3413042 RepID=UPI003BF0DD47